ncbi:MAG: type IV toxin-antitoxin system AbiEi family antitoxin [Balneola sp.]
MADSVYISKNLSAEQLRFMKLMDEYELLCFNMQEVEQTMNTTFDNLNEVLENLVDKEILRRLEKEKYARIDFSDIYTLATFISTNGVIGYWSALHSHGLTERFPNTVFVKTDRRKRNTTLLGTHIQFVTVNERKLKTGITKNGFGDRSYNITTPEATLIDCFDQPRYAGDFPDVLKAFAKASLQNDELIEYAGIVNNKAVIKRMGYLAEQIKPNDLKEFINFARDQVNKKYSLFEAGGPDEGGFNNRWRIRLNISEEDILNIIESPY